MAEDNIPDLQSSHVLVVDDEPLVRRFLVALLRREGYQVHEAGDATGALALLRGTAPVDIVISDLHMPGRDGMELLREIRAWHPDIAVIMVTGDNDVDVAVQCLKLGAQDYLTKPLNGREAIERVGKALDARRLWLENRRLREQYQSDLELQVGELSRKNQTMFLAQVAMAVSMLEAKDPYTRGHSHRVAGLAVATGRQMGLSEDMLEEIRLGGELHDIGKIGTRDAVLHKPGKLTPEEFDHIREHTTAGEAILRVLGEDHPEVLRITRSHHERLDGTGFPDGLCGEQIPLSARIVSLVDAFDAMTSHRPYAKQRGLPGVVEEIKRCAGTHFDVVVVSAFFAAHPEIEFCGSDGPGGLVEVANQLE